MLKYSRNFIFINGLTSFKNSSISVSLLSSKVEKKYFEKVPLNKNKEICHLKIKKCFNQLDIRLQFTIIPNMNTKNVISKVTGLKMWQLSLITILRSGIHWQTQGVHLVKR